MDYNSQKVEKRKLPFWLGLVIGISVTFIFMVVGTVVILGILTNGRNLVIGKPGATVNVGSVALDEATLKKIDEIYYYFGKESIVDYDLEDMRRAVIDGFIKGSSDKYAQYFDKDEMSDVITGYGGTFYGIGAVLALDDSGYVEVQSIYDDSPAEAAGLRAGDLITEVDGVSVLGKKLDEAVEGIQGDRYTEVDLTVYREGEKDYIHIVCIRDEIELHVIDYKMLEDNIGFIHIQQWYETTEGQFVDALDDLKSQGMQALVIDLRSNTGGLLTSVVGVAKQVLPEGLIVYTQNKNGIAEEYFSDGENEIDVPVVILTDGYTASASEIFTAAMKDHGKATIIGTKTYGKGVVQSFHYLGDGSGIKLTVEEYFTPNGTAINGVGIEPDIEVKFDKDAYYDKENPVDNQLEAAKDYLRDEIN